MHKHEKHHNHPHPHQASHKPPVLKMLVVIVDWHKVDIVKEIMRDFYVRFKYVCVGQGTANSELLEVLGIGHSDKGVVFCLQPEYCIKKMMDTISGKLWLSQPGNGIAFVLPLSGVSTSASQRVNDEKFKKLAESLSPEEREKYIAFHSEMKAEWEAHKMEAGMSNEIQNDLIVVLVNQGYSDELMDKAKEAGAGGGTVIPARRIGTEESVKFFGISVQSEKEIVAILTKREKKNDIMKAIEHSYGLASDARGIVFSLPVDGIAGLDLK